MIRAPSLAALGLTRFESAAALIIFVLFCAGHAAMPIGRWEDTVGYLFLRENASDPEAWRRFFVLRPGLIPLFYAVFSNDTLACLVQSAFSFASWLFLAVNVARRMEHSLLRSLLFVVLLAGALGQHVLFWNRVLSSESLSLSAMVLFVGSVFFYQRRNIAAPLIISTILLLFTRDTWVFFIPIAAAAILTPQHFRGPLRVWLIVAATVVATAAAIDTNERQQFPMKNNVFKRILMDPQAEAFFVVRGMPDVAEVKRACEDRFAFECTSPPAFDAWLAREGRKTYQLWLASTAPQQVAAFFREWRTWFELDLYIYNNKIEPRPAASHAVGWLTSIGGCSELTFLMLTAATIAASTFALWRARTLPRLTVSAWIVGGAAFFNMFVSYVGDALEVQRHVLLPLICIQLCCVIVLFSLAERFLSKRKVAAT